MRRTALQCLLQNSFLIVDAAEVWALVTDRFCFYTNSGRFD
jgi:hypothetical protein